MRSFKINIGGREYLVEIEDLSRSPISVVVNGKTYEVELEREGEVPGVQGSGVEEALERVRGPQERSAGPVSPGGSPVVAPSEHAIAPMPGKILVIKAKVGDQISLGDELCVLEAMKMEQSIRANRSGVIKAVRVEEGQMVSHGEVLFEFE